MNKIIYIKKTNPSNKPFFSAYFWKVTETHCLQITDSDIETEEIDDFFETVSFIKNTLCEGIYGNDSEEITKAEFDAFMIQTVNKINHISAA